MKAQSRVNINNVPARDYNKSKHDIDKEFVDEAVKQYLAEGGKITKLETLEKPSGIDLLIHRGDINRTVNKHYGPY